MTASELFAVAHGQSCQGDESCHWCGAPCEPIYRHNEAPGPAVRFGGHAPTTAKNPVSQWMCNGCVMFRKPLTTIYWHGGGLDDRRCPMDHNWWITEKKAMALRPDDSVYELLLNPPAKFTLLLLTPPKEENGKREQHHIHLAPINSADKIKPDTELRYMLDNQVRSYTLGELRAVLEDGSLNGKAGGVRTLVEFFGMTDKYLKKAGPGRPKQTQETAEAS